MSDYTTSNFAKVRFKLYLVVQPLLAEVARDLLRLDGLDVGVSADGAARGAEEGGEVGGLVLAAGPALVRVVEIRSPGVEGARLIVIVLDFKLLPAPSVITQLCCHHNYSGNIL